VGGAGKPPTFKQGKSPGNEVESCPLDRNVHAKTIFMFLLICLSPSENQAAKPTFFKFVVCNVCNEPRPRLFFHFLSFSFGRKTLVAAGHMTSQNLGGKKIW